jgi:integrase
MLAELRWPSDVRPGELRQAGWSEFDFDRALWVLPADKMEMRRFCAQGRPP